LESQLLMLCGVVALALFFDFLNGFHDAANVVATVVSSRAMDPGYVLLIVSTAEFIGPFLFGTAVAETIGRNLVDPKFMSIGVLVAALMGAIIWNLVTWWYGLPSSSSHALVGGLLGAVVMAYGIFAPNWGGFWWVVAVLIFSPIVGLIFGYLFQKVCTALAYGFTPRINVFFKRMQILSSLTLSLSHGANDAQKTMGIITMILLAMGYVQEFFVPAWVIFSCALSMALGTAFGGWRIVRTVGSKIYKLRPIHGFSAQTASATVILGAALLGGPVSTTHVVSSAIMGTGSADRVKAVRWGTAGNIVITWFLTIPASALMASLCFWLGQLLIGG